jgi:hypothetical protein
MLVAQGEESKNAMIGEGMSALVNAAIAQGGRLGKIGKAIAIAQTIWSTGQAVMKAMSDPALPWPSNLAAAASVAAKGAMQLANIRKTNVGSGGSVLSSGGASAAVGTASLPDNVAATAPKESEKSVAQVIIQGNVFSSQETADWIINQIRDAVNTRDVVLVSSNSRQAMELAGVA